MFPFGSPSSVSWVTDSTTGTAAGIRHQATRSAAKAKTTPAAATHNQRERERWVAITTGPLPDSDKASSAKARSDATWKRSVGFLLRHRFTSCCNPRGTVGAACEISGGSSLRIADIVSAEVAFRNARQPVNISYKIAPNAKMSER